MRTADLRTGKGIICGPKMRTVVRTLYPMPTQPMERKRMRALIAVYCLRQEGVGGNVLIVVWDVCLSVSRFIRQFLSVILLMWFLQ